MVWDFSRYCFDCWKDCCYGLITLVCGCWIAGAWGITMAYIAFPNIWCKTPFMLTIKLFTFHLFQRCFKAVIDCCIVPWTSSCSKFFRVFQVEIVKKEPEVKPQPSAVKAPLPVVKAPIPPNTPDKEDSFHDIFLGEPENMTKTVQRTLGLYMNKQKRPKNTPETEDITFE